MMSEFSFLDELLMSLITAESQSNSLLICETNVKVKTEEHFCKG